MTFEGLLESPTPCVDAITLVKDFAKAAMVAAGDLPHDVARVLYVTAILRGRQAGFHAISALDDASLERATRRCLTFGWLPDKVLGRLRSSLPGSSAS